MDRSRIIQVELKDRTRIIKEEEHTGEDRREYEDLREYYSSQFKEFSHQIQALEVTWIYLHTLVSKRVFTNFGSAWFFENKKIIIIR